ncbi:MAG: carbon-nitrogen hydrolase family protein [Gemmatimonadales bacterium]
MTTFRIALANLRYPATRDDSVALAVAAVEDAGRQGVGVVCFPECYVPGYRTASRAAPPPDATFLERARHEIAAAAGQAHVAVILGTERFAGERLHIAALVINRDGSIAGFQDKVQLDPSEDAMYSPGRSRRVFESGALRFGISICHEGWRYPETVRWAARHGAQIVFHPHFHEAEGDSFRPTSFADPRNTFHEKAALCRAAENTIWFATVNCAGEGSPTTSAVVRPDGMVQCWQPYGVEGLLIADIELEAATGVLAGRWRTAESLT